MCFGSLKYFFVYRAKRRVFYRSIFACAFPFTPYNGMRASISVKEISSKIFKDVFQDKGWQMHLPKDYPNLYMLIVIYNLWSDVQR